MSDALSDRLVLGVDGGGSKTIAKVVSVTTRSDDPGALGEAQVQAIGMAGPSNPNRVGWETAQGNLSRAIDGAISQLDEGANDRVPTIDRAFLSVAGLGTEPDQNRLRRWARPFPWARSLTVSDDAQVILRSIECAQVPFALALIGGTGSVAFGTDKRGQITRCGGWGEQWGDAGSATWLANESLRKVTQWCDGRATCEKFSRAVLNHLGISDCDAFRIWLRRVRPDSPIVRDLALLVRRLADEGDPTADALRLQAASALARLVECVTDQLGVSSDESASYQLAMTGGWLVSDLRLQESILSILGDKVGKPWSVHRIERPVDCAVSCAIRALQVES